MESMLRNKIQGGAKIIIASHNQGKIEEFKTLLSFLEVEILTAKDFPQLDSPEETGSSFQQNAILKAKYVAQETGLMALADDSGLEVASIQGKPGIYSARWGNGGDFAPAFARIKKEMEQADNFTNTKARFVCALALCDPRENQSDNQTQTWTGVCEGNITFPPQGREGFGYDPIFKPQGSNLTYAQLDSAEKNKTSHRMKALNLFKNDILRG